jgi:hypothetical protein
MDNPDEREAAMIKRKLMGLGVAVALVLSVAAARAADAPPDATIELKEGSVAAGIGFSWGSGTLTYKGKSYPVSVEGLSVGAVGITEATAKGKVYGLTDLTKFDGVYTAAAVGATTVAGGNVAAMKNQNDVRIELFSITRASASRSPPRA